LFTAPTQYPASLTVNVTSSTSLTVKWKVRDATDFNACIQWLQDVFWNDLSNWFRPFIIQTRYFCLRYDENKAISACYIPVGGAWINWKFVYDQIWPPISIYKHPLDLWVLVLRLYRRNIADQNLKTKLDSLSSELLTVYLRIVQPLFSVCSKFILFETLDSCKNGCPSPSLLSLSPLSFTPLEVWAPPLNPARGLGTAVSSPAGPAAKQFMVNFELKVVSLMTLNQQSTNYLCHWCNSIIKSWVSYHYGTVHPLIKS